MHSQISDEKSKASLILEEKISLSILDCTEIPSFLFTLNESQIDKLFLCSGSCWKILWKYFLLQERWWLNWKIATWCWAVFNHKYECGCRSQKNHAKTLCFSFLINSSSMSTTTVTDFRLAQPLLMKRIKLLTVYYDRTKFILWHQH